MEPTDLKKLLGVPFSVIPGTDVDPLWGGWFLKRHVTIVVAPGGTGKGFLMNDMAARVSTGRPFPGEEDEETGEKPVREPANVIIIAPEDDPNEALAWRLQAAGADMSRVFNLTILPDGSPFIVPDSVGTLHECISQIEDPDGPAAHPGPVALVVIDPLFAVVDKPVTTNANARRVTTPLERLANETGACIALTHHTVKDGKVAGVKALTDSVRCVLRIEREKSDDPESTGRIISVEKTNVLSGTQTIRYVMVGEGKETALAWPSETDQLAESLTEARGYVIDPDRAFIADRVEQAVPSIDLEAEDTAVELWQTSGGEPAVSLGQFADADAAMDFARKKCLVSLKWKKGPVEGSYGASFHLTNGMFSFYSVMPLDAPCSS